MADGQIVYVVDDDAAVRDSLSWLLRSVGLQVESFDSGVAFFDYVQREGCDGCAILDVRMPGLSGLELQERLMGENITLPLIIITGHGDVPMAVRAVKAGAFDFIEKPFNDQLLLDRVQQALQQNAQHREEEEKRQKVETRLESLTPREREVLELVVVGNPNKAIATQLGISCRTVEIHRGRVMEKMQAGSLSELVRLGVGSGLF